MCFRCSTARLVAAIWGGTDTGHLRHCRKFWIALVEIIIRIKITHNMTPLSWVPSKLNKLLWTGLETK